MFGRKIYNRLLSWKQDSNGHTALLIEGARRVGKSTLVEEFAKREYDSYILIDFSNAPLSVRELFDDMSDLNYFFLQLQLIYNTKLTERKSLIVFDEVQTDRKKISDCFRRSSTMSLSQTEYKAPRSRLSL